MKVRVEVEMLPMVVALFLALGVSDSLVIDKCQLGDELNSTLPANLLDQITNLVAKVVCHVELSSRFNTSAINYVTGPNVHSFKSEHHGGRKGKSAGSSSEESSEEDTDSSSGAGRRRRSASESSSEESSEEDINSSSGAGRRRRSASESSSEESRERNVQVPKHGFNSSTVNPVTRPQGNSSFSGKSHKERKGRSAESSSEESSEEDTDSSSGAGRRRRSASESSSEESHERNIQVPKHGFNSSTVNPVTRPQGNSSFSGKSHKERKGRSAESSSRESDERNVWTLYGLFQLPDHIACTSGFEPSLNLCSMTCDSLIDDDIGDDIKCVETILNKMLSAGNSQGPSKALFKKLHEAFFQKDCSNVEDLEYLSAC